MWKISHTAFSQVEERIKDSPKWEIVCDFTEKRVHEKGVHCFL